MPAAVKEKNRRDRMRERRGGEGVDGWVGDAEEGQEGEEEQDKRVGGEGGRGDEAKASVCLLTDGSKRQAASVPRHCSKAQQQRKSGASTLPKSGIVS